MANSRPLLSYKTWGTAIDGHPIRLTEVVSAGWETVRFTGPLALVEAYEKSKVCQYSLQTSLGAITAKVYLVSCVFNIFGEYEFVAERTNRKGIRK